METLRDSLLLVSGKLDPTAGGEAEPIANNNYRRSLYLTISRTVLDPEMALFDFPDANTSVDQRTITAGPLQGLYWLNSQFVAEQANALNERLVKDAGNDIEPRIRRAYQLLYARLPDSDEMKLGVEYVKEGGSRWPQYLQVLLGAAEFASVN